MDKSDGLALLLLSLLAWVAVFLVGIAIVTGYRQVREFYTQGLNELVMKDTYARKFNRYE
jgi:hypothetical protein